MAFVPSQYQQAAADLITSGKSTIIEAVAGSGKTTTIVWIAGLIKARAVLFLAFNKAIATELGERLPKHVLSGTFHSICFKALNRAASRRIKVNGSKFWGIANDWVDAASTQYDHEQRKATLKRLGAPVMNLIGKAHAHGLVPATARAHATEGCMPDTDENWLDLMAHYDINGMEPEDKLEVIDLARTWVATGIFEYERRGINFDEMLYLPVVLGMPFFENDVVFVDEAQDVSVIQREVLRRVLKPAGQLIAVGDPHQAIYGFRGADADSMSIVAEMFDCVRAPLSISYRCPKAVVAFAQQFVSHIESHPDAPEGSYETLSAYRGADFNDSDVIVCRNTAPLVEMAYKLIIDGVGCRILGREIGQGLVKLIEKLNAKGIPALQEKLTIYGRREILRLESEEKESQIEALQDKLSCINVFIDNLPETDSTVPALTRQIMAMFEDQDKGLLTLCSVHKSKGLEWNRVFILNRAALMPSKFARQDWQMAQEINLIYVAGTRAKDQLFDIETEGYITKAA